MTLAIKLGAVLNILCIGLDFVVTFISKGLHIKISLTLSACVIETLNSYLGIAVIVCVQ